MTNYLSWVYGIQSGLFIKIGVANDIPARLKTMNLYNPHPCKVVARRRTLYSYLVEKHLHETLAPYSIGREWFMVDAALVRAAMTIAIKKVTADQITQQIEIARRSALYEARKAAQAARGQEGDLRTREWHKRRKAFRNKTLEEYQGE